MDVIRIACNIVVGAWIAFLCLFAIVAMLTVMLLGVDLVINLML